MLLDRCRMAWHEIIMTARKYWGSMKINRYALVWSLYSRAAYLLNKSGVMDCVWERVLFGSIFFYWLLIRRTITWMRFHVEHIILDSWWWWGRFIAKFKCTRYASNPKWKSLGYKSDLLKLHCDAKSYNEYHWTKKHVF